MGSNRDNVIPLKRPDCSAPPRRPLALRLVRALYWRVLDAGDAVVGVLLFFGWLTFHFLRLCLAALLMLLEPLVTLVLVGMGFGCFMVDLIFGWLAHSPGFPRFGMLAFSIACILLYWLYLIVMFWVARGPRGNH